ncbi:NAD(P)H nitroreductase [Thalassomonas actiniarum]|uniref:Putative NAD(P)H nitroreductase n=1 Tax=Thalassomonas actiniarum TaxID=485447 RepID=A0AAF0C631_9GAMM|nr:NAD(P)H nitroreductase [Thalassomonas actiniarum]WDE01560.1 NAD(P)H nitroreductase [Thalassomonas actiniarum]
MNQVPQDAIELLLQRQSNPFLEQPAPNQEDLDKILTAAMRVPDHGGLAPWHFTVIENQGLDKLSDVLVSAAVAKNAEETKVAKAKKMPYRAPMIIVVSTKFIEHKVPEQEQLIAAGCAAHAMQMAAFALGYGAMWRTGEFSYNAQVKQGLNIKLIDQIVGFLYLGTESKTLPAKPVKPYQDFVSYLK